MLAKTNSLLNHILHVSNDKLPNNLTNLRENENITLFHLTVSMSPWFHLGLLSTAFLLLIESFAYNINPGLHVLFLTSWLVWTEAVGTIFFLCIFVWH